MFVIFKLKICNYFFFKYDKNIRNFKGFFMFAILIFFEWQDFHHTQNHIQSHTGSHTHTHSFSSGKGGARLDQSPRGL